MGHEVAAYLAAGVSQPIATWLITVQQQARRLHSAGAKEHRPAALAEIHAVVFIDHRCNSPVGVYFEVVHEAFAPDLGR